MIKFDAYSIKARVYPCTIVLFPLFLLAIINITDVEVYFHYFTSFAALGIFSFLFSQIGRDNGKKKEKILFKHWGGKPTNIILRHSNGHLDVHTKKRFHNRLEQIIPDIKIPTPEEEQENPEAADALYDSCTRNLIARTRDASKYPLVFKELINYGFRRNLWGMKTWALLTIITCLLIHSLIATQKFTTIEALRIEDLAYYGILIMFALFWLFIVNKAWIKITAFTYAERLHETLQE